MRRHRFNEFGVLPREYILSWDANKSLKLIIRFRILIVSCLVCIQATAQQTLHTKSFTTDDGLPRNFVGVVQDSMGFLMVEAGSLVKFDGHEFSPWHLADRDTVSTGSFVIQGVDEDGIPWLGDISRGIIARYDYKRAKFLFYNVAMNGAKLRSLTRAKGENLIWLGTRGDGLFLFNLVTRQTKHYVNTVGDPGVSQFDPVFNEDENFIYMILHRHNHLLLGTGQGLWRFDLASGRFSLVDLKGASIENSKMQVVRIFRNKDCYWFQVNDWTFTNNFTARFTLIKTDTSFNVLQEFRVPDRLHPDSPFIMNFVQDHDDTFWFNCNDGIARYDPIGERLVNFPGEKLGLPPTQFMSFGMDRDGNLWASSFSGLVRITVPRIEFQNFLFDQSVSGLEIIESEQTSKLLLVMGSGPYTIDIPLKSKKATKLLPCNVHNTPSLSLIRTLEKRGSRVWMTLMTNGGLKNTFIQLKYDIENGLYQDTQSLKFDYAPYSPGEPFSGIVYNMVSDTERSLLASTFQNKIGGWNRNVLDRVLLDESYQIDTVLHYEHDPNDSMSISAGATLPYVEPDGTVWISTDAGLDIMKDGKFIHVLEKETLCAMRDSQGNLLVGTTEGLYVGKLANKKYTFNRYTEPGGVAITALQEDKLGRVWMATTNQGLLCFDRADKIVHHFKTSEGIPDNEFGFISDKTKHGTMIFATTSAITIFNPEDFVASQIAYEPVLTEVRVNNKVATTNTLPDRGYGVTLPSGVNVLEELVLNHNHHILTIEFAVLEFTNPEQNNYMYTLEGFDPEWVNVDYRSRSATYTNLDPGTYTFKVKASNHHGIWSEGERTLKVVVLPPPWRTTWAYTGYGLLVAVLLFWARRNIVNHERLSASLQLAKLEQEKEHFKLEKAMEVDRIKTSFFTNISHEFRTPLTLIKGPVETLLNRFKDDPDVVQRLKLVQRNSDLLLKLINQLLDLAKLESGTMKVEKSHIDIHSFIRAIASSFESLARQKNLSLSVDVHSHQHLALFDRDKLETILINLINNAIKFTPSGGKVTVQAHATNDFLTIRVQDSGIGIPTEHQQKIFERFHQVSEAHKEVGTGIGLSLVKELVQLLNGSIDVSSEPGKGTTFMVTLPLEVAFESSERIIAEETAMLHDHSSNEFHSISDNGGPERPHVLVVEDNDDLRAFIIDSLGREFHFLEADNGRKGLDIATTEIPDLIISDIMMPEMDGITMAAKVKSDQRSNHIPLILLTAKSTEDSKLHGLKSGADDYLTKPFNKEELLLKVRNGISRQIKLREKLRAELMGNAPKVQVLSEDERFLVGVKEKILERLSDEQLSVESLAEDIGISRVHLYRKVSGLTGMSVNELIRKLRLQRAAQLLSQNWGPVSQVAYEVGYSNLSYFSKVFKEEFGKLPSNYAEKC